MNPKPCRGLPFEAGQGARSVVYLPYMSDEQRRHASKGKPPAGLPPILRHAALLAPHVRQVHIVARALPGTKWGATAGLGIHQRLPNGWLRRKLLPDAASVRCYPWRCLRTRPETSLPPKPRKCVPEIPGRSCCPPVHGARNSYQRMLRLIDRTKRDLVRLRGVKIRCRAHSDHARFMPGKPHFSTLTAKLLHASFSPLNLS